MEDFQNGSEIEKKKKQGKGKIAATHSSPLSALLESFVCACVSDLLFPSIHSIAMVL